MEKRAKKMECYLRHDVFGACGRTSCLALSPSSIPHMCKLTFVYQRLHHWIRLHILHLVGKKSIGLVYLIVGMRQAQTPIHTDNSQIKVSLFSPFPQPPSTLFYSTLDGTGPAKNDKLTFLMDFKEGLFLSVSF